MCQLSDTEGNTGEARRPEVKGFQLAPAEKRNLPKRTQARFSPKRLREDCHPGKGRRIAIKGMAWGELGRRPDKKGTCRRQHVLPKINW